MLAKTKKKENIRIRTIGPSDQWPFGLVAFRTNGSLEYRDVTLLSAYGWVIAVSLWMSDCCQLMDVSFVDYIRVYYLP